MLDDVQKLYKDRQVSTRNCVDLSLLARSVDNAQWKGKYNTSLGLARLVEVYEGLKLLKGKVTRSNWELSRLSSHQIECPFLGPFTSLSSLPLVQMPAMMHMRALFSIKGSSPWGNQWKRYPTQSITALMQYKADSTNPLASHGTRTIQITTLALPLPRSRRNQPKTSLLHQVVRLLRLCRIPVLFQMTMLETDVGLGDMDWVSMVVYLPPLVPQTSCIPPVEAPVGARNIYPDRMKILLHDLQSCHLVETIYAHSFKSVVTLIIMGPVQEWLQVNSDKLSFSRNISRMRLGNVGSSVLIPRRYSTDTFFFYVGFIVAEGGLISDVIVILEAHTYSHLSYDMIPV